MDFFQPHRLTLICCSSTGSLCSDTATASSTVPAFTVLPHRSLVVLASTCRWITKEMVHLGWSWMIFSSRDVDIPVAGLPAATSSGARLLWYFWCLPFPSLAARAGRTRPSVSRPPCLWPSASASNCTRRPAATPLWEQEERSLMQQNHRWRSKQIWVWLKGIPVYQWTPMNLQIGSELAISYISAFNHPVVFGWANPNWHGYFGNVYSIHMHGRWTQSHGEAWVSHEQSQRGGSVFKSSKCLVKYQTMHFQY